MPGGLLDLHHLVVFSGYGKFVPKLMTIFQFGALVRVKAGKFLAFGYVRHTKPLSGMNP
jgi:hypothetical protein